MTPLTRFTGIVTRPIRSRARPPGGAAGIAIRVSVAAAPDVWKTDP